VLATSVALGDETAELFPNDGLWEWHKLPAEVRLDERAYSEAGTEERAATVSVVELLGRDSAPQIIVVQDLMPLVVFGNVDSNEYRVVALDEKRQRLKFGGGMQGSYSGVDLSIKQVIAGSGRLKYIGIEKISAANQKLRYKQASEKLSGEGILITNPVDGDAFPYRFGAKDSVKIDSTRHAGDVVIVQCWASW